MKRKYNTKFPTARIKRIMQKDEDVGKVAAGAPPLISKALEIFMQSLVDLSSEETKARNSRRITPAHVKKTVMSVAQFDFLRELVKDIPDVEADTEKAPKRRAKKSKDNSEDGGDGAVTAAPPKKRNSTQSNDGVESSSSGNGKPGKKRGRPAKKKDEEQTDDKRFKSESASSTPALLISTPTPSVQFFPVASTPSVIPTLTREHEEEDYDEDDDEDS